MHTGVWFLKTQVRFEGSEKIYTREVEGTGRTISFHFCPTCGSSVYWHCDLRPDWYGTAAYAGVVFVGVGHSGLQHAKRFQEEICGAEIA